LSDYFSDAKIDNYCRKQVVIFAKQVVIFTNNALFLLKSREFLPVCAYNVSICAIKCSIAQEKKTLFCRFRVVSVQEAVSCMTKSSVLLCKK